MVGNNEMLINHATMREAINLWLAEKVFQGEQAVTCTDVRAEQNGHHNQFRLSLLSPSAVEAGAK